MNNSRRLCGGRRSTHGQSGLGLTAVIVFLAACSGGQGYDDGSDALGAKSDHGAQTSNESAALSFRAPALCTGCYVVNSAVTGNDVGDVFVASYFGASDSPDRVLRRYSNGEWSELARWDDDPNIVRQLWASDDAVYGTTGETLWRYDIERDEREILEPAAVSVWGTSGSSVFALTNDSVLRWDGASWSNESSPLGELTPLGVGGSGAIQDQRGPSPVYALSELGAVSRFNGDGTWEPPSDPLDVELNDFAASGDAIFAVAGDDAPEPVGPGTIARFQDTEWVSVQDAPGDALLGVAATRTDIAYAVGASRDESNIAHAVVWKLENDQWTRRQLNVEAVLWDVWCAATGPCFASGTDNVFIALDELD